MFITKDEATRLYNEWCASEDPVLFHKDSVVEGMEYDEEDNESLVLDDGDWLPLTSVHKEDIQLSVYEVQLVLNTRWKD